MEKTTYILTGAQTQEETTEINNEETQAEGEFFGPLPADAEETAIETDKEDAEKIKKSAVDAYDYVVADMELDGEDLMEQVANYLNDISSNSIVLSATSKKQINLHF